MSRINGDDTRGEGAVSQHQVNLLSPRSIPRGEDAFTDVRELRSAAIRLLVICEQIEDELDGPVAA